jgi:DNA invertase Pin-like site-specific DNA recombinase
LAVKTYVLDGVVLDEDQSAKLQRIGLERFVAFIDSVDEITQQFPDLDRIGRMRVIIRAAFDVLELSNEST